MRNRHLQKRSQTVRDLMKSPSANYRIQCPHITENSVRELPKPALTENQNCNWKVGIGVRLRHSFPGHLPALS